MVQRAAFWVNSVDAAEDIVQEIFVRAWKSRQKFEGVANVEAYLMRWLKNDSLNYIKR